MPVLVMKNQAFLVRKRFRIDGADHFFRVFQHVLLQMLPLEIDGMQTLRHIQGLNRLVGQQTFNAERHILQAAGGVDFRANPEPDRQGVDFARFQPTHRCQCGDSGLAATGIDARQPGTDESPVVRVQSDHVSDGADGHQIQQTGQICPPAPLMTHLPAHGQKQIENDAHAGQRLAGKGTARLVRIQDGGCRRQDVAGKMVISDQYAVSAGIGRRHSGIARDAAVYGDD